MLLIHIHTSNMSLLTGQHISSDEFIGGGWTVATLSIIPLMIVAVVDIDMMR